jgi:hypothetical protein
VFTFFRAVQSQNKDIEGAKELISETLDCSILYSARTQPLSTRKKLLTFMNKLENMKEVAKASAATQKDINEVEMQTYPSP